VKIIRKSKDTPTAGRQSAQRFKLSRKQSAEILNHAARPAHALEITKLDDELKEVRKFIKECRRSSGRSRGAEDPQRRALELAHGFATERRTEIVADQGEFSIEDLIAEETW